MPDLVSFHEMVKRGDLSGIKAALLEMPALLDEQNQAGQSAFLLAKYYRQEDVAAYLLEQRPQLDLFTACVAGDADRVFAFLSEDGDAIHSHNQDGWTPLHLAAFFGHVQLAAALVDRGADVDARSTNAMTNTPLHAAVAGGHTEAVRLLADRGSKVNASQHGGWTALHGAAQAGNREIVEILIAHGADVNARAENNQSPLDLALLHKRDNVAALLEELGARLQ
jgi:ankyrin repeat protein